MIIFFRTHYYLVMLLSRSKFIPRFFSSNRLTLAQAFQDPRLLIFDVTSAHEFADTVKANQLPRKDVIHLPISDLAAQKALLGTENDRPMVFYCKHGVRAGMAAGFAQREGFFNSFAMTDAMAVGTLLKEFSK